MYAVLDAIEGTPISDFLSVYPLKKEIDKTGETLDYNSSMEYIRTYIAAHGDIIRPGDGGSFLINIVLEDNFYRELMVQSFKYIDDAYEKKKGYRPIDFGMCQWLNGGELPHNKNKETNYLMLVK